MLPQKETYLTNSNVKKDGIVQKWNTESVKEYALCMKDPVYFSQKYVKIISLDHGINKELDERCCKYFI